MVRVLVTRPEPAASRTARSLAARGHTPLLAPMLRMRRLSPADRDVPADGAALAVTSARAIEAVADTPMWETLRDLPVFAVGEATARAARTAGAARVVPAGGDLDALAAQVVRAHPRRVIYLAGRQRSGDLCAVLRAAGIACDLHEVYDMETAPAPSEALRAVLEETETPLAAPVYSRRSAEALAAALSGLDSQGKLVFFALSEQIADPLRAFGPCHVASEPSEPALIALLEKTC
ncbi:uroporphyrinogen-III synthase [Stappia sp. ES.058]|uniref:uroporphyrinogen-III synthase n=1 Tax=Stappia sp. ES.058 TaxID=1881061 RepID=UPI00087CE0B6|nr:uroporphyrinogen-III synthase [Stappia sp. ES.058]SDU41221.1 uroporphyrinogen-III synthase [Stappia sp. ES.058]